jgi:hypothetical protein
MNIRNSYGVRDNGFRNIVRFVAFNDDVARAEELFFEQLRSNAVFALGLTHCLDNCFSRVFRRHETRALFQQNFIELCKN